MKVGDLVRCNGDLQRRARLKKRDSIEVGIIVGFTIHSGGLPVVYWSNLYPGEVEYKEQLEVINEV